MRASLTFFLIFVICDMKKLTLCNNLLSKVLDVLQNITTFA